MIKIIIREARELIRQGVSIFDMNLRVVYYARVSTDSEEQLNSLENQQKFFEEYIDNSKSWIYAGRYVDEGISGTGVNKRKSFLKMIQDGVDGKFDMILTKEVSRFARNTIDSLKYTEKLLKNGVIVNFLNDNFNTIEESSEFKLTLMASLSQDEVRKLSQRVKFGLARSVKDGKVLGGGNITGYYKDKGRLYINEEEAEMIRLLFDLYSTGKYGFRVLAQKLYDKGYKDIKGNPYSERTLSRMITNPKYKGYYCGNKSYVADYKEHKKVPLPKDKWLVYKDENIPAIVTEEVWDLANEVYNNKSKMYGSYVKGAKNLYNSKNIYTGKLFCSEHGCTFCRNGSGQRSTNPVWQCTVYHRFGLKSCQTPTLYEKHLDKIFKKIIQTFLSKKDLYLDNILNDYIKIINKNSNESEIRKLEDKIVSDEKLKNKLYKLVSDDCISNMEFKEKNDELNKRIQQNKREIVNLQSNEINEENYKKKIKQLKKTLENLLDVNKSYKELFDLIIKKVYVSKIDNDRKKIKLDIIFNFGEEPLLLGYMPGQNNDIMELPLMDSKGTGCICYSDSTNNSSFISN